MWMKLKGYRRFKEEQTINLSGKLICLIGSNEAGKTSILKALENLNNDTLISKSDIYKTTTENPEETYIKAKFLLSLEDADESNLLPNSKLEITKTDKLERVFSFDPEPSKRDITDRLYVNSVLTELIKNDKFVDEIQKVKPNSLTIFNRLLSFISADSEDFNVATLKQQIEQCKNILKDFKNDMFEKEKQTLEKSFEQLIVSESKPNPTNYAINILKNKIPTFLLFKDEDRNLQYQYVVGEIEKKPRPLLTLSKLAELNLPMLVKAINDDDSARYTGMLAKANEKLKDIFDGKWSQSLLEVKLEIKNKSLEILLHEGDYEYSELSRRSEGFRQFLALVSFAHLNDNENIILLIDEIELHLHYDGQADLLQTLAKQNLAKKIIYTTHSIGSLPEDLGGVKIVQRTQEDFTSAIENKFWKQGNGIATLLPNIGAEQLAFLPLRYAVIVEGAMDMLLLPAIFQEATEKDNLGFLMVHGMAEESFEHIVYLEKRNGSKALYLTDCDSQGKEYHKQLTEQGVDQNRIFALPGDFDNNIATLEDMLTKECLVLAFNSLIKKYATDKSEINIDSISNQNKADGLKTLADDKGISDVKIALAYEILELIQNNPSMNIVDEAQIQPLKNLYTKIFESFEIK